MKKVVWGLVTIGLISMLSAQSAEAWWGKKSKKDSSVSEPAATSTEQSKQAQPQAAAQTPKTKVPEAPRDEAASRKKQLLARKVAELNNTEWSAELASSGNPSKKQAIKIAFKDNKVSTTYSAGEFPQTNYTLSYAEDGTLVWETMQTGQKQQGVAFWRGEISPDMTTMRGILSHQLSRGNVDYTFVSTEKERLAPQE